MREDLIKAKERFEVENEIRKEIFSNHKNEIIVGFKNGQIGIFTDSLVINSNEVVYISANQENFNICFESKIYESFICISKKRTCING